jgi:hypothetical protein
LNIQQALDSVLSLLLLLLLHLHLDVGPVYAFEEDAHSILQMRSGKR